MLKIPVNSCEESSAVQVTVPVMKNSLECMMLCEMFLFFSFYISSKFFFINLKDLLFKELPENGCLSIDPFLFFL